MKLSPLQAALVALLPSTLSACGGAAATPPVTAPSPVVEEGEAPIVQATWRPPLLSVAPVLVPGRAPPKPPASAVPGVGQNALVIDGDRLGHDPGVAVGDRYAMIYTAHAYKLYDKASGRPLPTEAGDEIAPTGSFNTLFAPLWAFEDDRGNVNASNINLRLHFAPDDPLPCKPAAPSAARPCVQEFYDSRVLWDPVRKRFWIESAARNHLWACTPSPTETCADRTLSRTQARRFIAVAVSRTEDPRKGFHRYILVEEYADWPKMGVSDRWLILGHRSSLNVYVFDADKLAAGNPGGGRVRVAKLGAESFPGVGSISPVTHDGAPSGLTYLVGSDDTRLVPFALVPKGTDAAAAIPGPRIETGHSIGSFEQNPVYMDGKLHLTWDACVPKAASATGASPPPSAGCEDFDLIRVLRVPVRPSSASFGGAPFEVSTSPRDGFLSGSFGIRESGDAPGDIFSYEKPVMAVNQLGDMVFGFSRRGVRTVAPVPPEVRTLVWAHGEAAPRPSEIVMRGTYEKVPDINDGHAGIDLGGASLDPVDRTSVWVSHAYADEGERWYKQVTAVVRPSPAAR